MTDDALIGTSIYGCRILRVIGKGAKGVVYLAHQESLDRPVAVKLLPSSRSAEDYKTLLAEAQATAKISHPNVVRVYEAGIEDRKPFIVMELLEGETLAERLRRAGKLPVEAVIKLSIEIAAGLAAAHHAGIVHRDLKPSNVYLRPSAALKIIDFGLAYLGAANPRETGGTPEFMAPEQWKFAKVDGRTDLYALGLMLYRMLTGKPAFTGKTIEEFRKAHLEKPVPIALTHNSRIACVVAVIRQLAQKAPAQRYQNAETALEDLERIRDGQRPSTADQCGEILVCPGCDSRTTPTMSPCPVCRHDFTTQEVKVEDLLPDEPAPSKKANYPHGVRDLKRQRRR